MQFTKKYHSLLKLSSGFEADGVRMVSEYLYDDENNQIVVASFNEDNYYHKTHPVFKILTYREGLDFLDKWIHHFCREDRVLDIGDSKRKELLISIKRQYILRDII
jgi:hypothetical protein